MNKVEVEEKEETVAVEGDVDNDNSRSRSSFRSVRTARESFKKRCLQEMREEEKQAPSVFAYEIHPIRYFPNLSELSSPGYQTPKMTEEEMRNSVMLSKLVKPKHANDDPAKTARDKAAHEIMAFVRKLKSVKDGTYKEDTDPSGSQPAKRTRTVQFDPVCKVMKTGEDGGESNDDKSMEDLE